MLFFNGKSHKLESVHFGISQKEGKDDFMSPWRFTSSDGRFEMDFRPVFDRQSDLNAMLIRSDSHQVFGLFQGKAVFDTVPCWKSAIFPVSRKKYLINGKGENLSF